MTTTEIRAEAVRLMKSREKKNSYTQGAKRDYFFGYPTDGPTGFSDCSSSVRHAIKRATGGMDIGSNTSTQIDRRKNGVVIEMANGRSCPTESLLMPGDCVYFKGNTAHTWNAGHVELYIGNGMLMGHGSGTGPVARDMKRYCKTRTGARGYLCTIRWIKDGDVEAPSGARTLGARLLKYGAYGEDVKELQARLKALKYFGGSIGGNYLELTTAAVRAFQRAAGLTADGEYGPLTHGALTRGAAESGDRQRVVAVSGKAWIRSEPDASLPNRIGDVRTGDELIYMGETSSSGWHKVVWKDKAGWISGKYGRLREGSEDDG